MNAFKWDRAGEGVSPHFMALLDVARESAPAESRRLHQRHRRHLALAILAEPRGFHLAHGQRRRRLDRQGRRPREVAHLSATANAAGYSSIKSPLYPLNSVMHHGIVHGRCFQGESVGKSGPNLKNEARSYFANGTVAAGIVPHALDDDRRGMGPRGRGREMGTRQCRRAARRRTGSAATRSSCKPTAMPHGARGKGTLMLRNPDDRPQAITLDAANGF